MRLGRQRLIRAGSTRTPSTKLPWRDSRMQWWLPPTGSFGRNSSTSLEGPRTLGIRQVERARGGVLQAAGSKLGRGSRASIHTAPDRAEDPAGRSRGMGLGHTRSSGASPPALGQRADRRTHRPADATRLTRARAGRGLCDLPCRLARGRAIAGAARLALLAGAPRPAEQIPVADQDVQAPGAIPFRVDHDLVPTQASKVTQQVPKAGVCLQSRNVLDRHLDARRLAEVPDPNKAEAERSDSLLGSVDPGQQVPSDPDPVGDPRGKAGEGGLVRDRETQAAGDGAYRRLADACLQKWISNASLTRGFQPRAEIPRVVRIRAGKQDRSGFRLIREQPGQVRVQLRLAVEAPHRLVPGVGLSLDLVGLDGSMLNPQRRGDLPGGFQLSIRITRRNRCHCGDDAGAHRTRGKGCDHSRVDASGEGNQGPAGPVRFDRALEHRDHLVHAWRRCFVMDGTADELHPQRHRPSMEAKRGLLAAAEASSYTSLMGRPRRRATAATSSCSGVALITRPPRTPIFTRTESSPIETVTMLRSQSARRTGEERTPNVDVVSKKAMRSLVATAGSPSAERTRPGRPFFMMTGVVHTSRAPAARRALAASATSSGVRSSRFASMTSRSRSTDPPPSKGWAASSPSTTLTTFG